MYMHTNYFVLLQKCINNSCVIIYLKEIYELTELRVEDRISKVYLYNSSVTHTSDESVFRYIFF